MADAIRYFDRASGEMATEQVYGERALRFIYGNPLGRLTLFLVVKRAFFSRYYGRQMDRPHSRARIQPFIDEFRIDRSEMADAVEDFATFNEFFYRKLRPEARPIAAGEGVATLPADGRHLAFSDVSKIDGVFVKGQTLNVARLLGDAEIARRFEGGSILMSRLCPVDYHRFHFPAAGVVGTTQTMPGPLSSVSPIALRRDLGILWRNRRTRTLLDTETFGTVAIVEIGATCVGGIEQTYESQLDDSRRIAKGAEKGYFRFGGSSTALVFEPGRIELDADLLEKSAQGIEVYAKMGERFGQAG